MKLERGQGSTAIVAIFAILIIAALVYFFVFANPGGGDTNVIITVPTLAP